ncbi:YraN family protein [Candidatus Palauibacter sp.]|uniref:YraN family protein n=1 Tax=Candidatus Palauibacter sp. TaxID=3101350 RepID=UPI003B5CDF82
MRSPTPSVAESPAPRFRLTAERTGCRVPARATGNLGERLAARHLAAEGYEILDRNWRVGRLEIDLVARTGDTVAFVEVKTRRSGVQSPSEALSRAQRRRIRGAAGAWIRQHPGVGTEFRFDLVAVEFDPGRSHRIEHIPEAFYGDDLF